MEKHKKSPVQYSKFNVNLEWNIPKDVSGWGADGDRGGWISVISATPLPGTANRTLVLVKDASPYGPCIAPTHPLTWHYLTPTLITLQIDVPVMKGPDEDPLVTFQFLSVFGLWLCLSVLLLVSVSLVVCHLLALVFPSYVFVFMFTFDLSQTLPESLCLMFRLLPGLTQFQ